MAFGSITALAAEGQTTDIWDGTADTSWYTGHETESEYHITTAEQLAGLAQPGDEDAGVDLCRGCDRYPVAPGVDVASEHAINM